MRAATKEIQRFCTANTEIYRNMLFLMSIPGIGGITASHLLARIGDWREMGNVRQLAQAGAQDFVWAQRPHFVTIYSRSNGLYNSLHFIRQVPHVFVKGIMMRQRSEEKLRPLAAYVPEKIYEQVHELAKIRRWSLSVAVGYLIEEGLRATEGGGDILKRSVRDDSEPAEVTTEHKQRKAK